MVLWGFSVRNRQVFRVHDERTIPAEMTWMAVYKSKGSMIVTAGCDKRSVRARMVLRLLCKNQGSIDVEKCNELKICRF
jgi:hypothetical protein